MIKQGDKCGYFLAFLYHGIWTDVGLLVVLGVYNAISKPGCGGQNLAVSIAILDSYALICSVDAALGSLFFLVHFIYVAIGSSEILR